MALRGALALSRTLHMVYVREGQSGIERETVGMQLKHTSVLAVKHAEKKNDLSLTNRRYFSLSKFYLRATFYSVATSET